MTCIVGLVGNTGTVYMGGDSAGGSGYSLSIRKDEKVFRNGEFLIGITDSFRMGNLLRYRLQPPVYPPDMNVVEFMSTSFVDACRNCFMQYGYGKKENNVESGGEFLIGFRGNLFRIEGDYQVGLVREPYDAVGCGADIALGVMYGTRNSRVYSVQAERRVKLALEAAENFSAGVRRPFVIRKM